MDIARRTLFMHEVQVIVAADQQGAIGQQRQDIAVGNNTGVAENDVDRLRLDDCRQIRLGPFHRLRNIQHLTRRLRIGIDRVGGKARNDDRPSAHTHLRTGRCIGCAAALVDDVGQHVDAERAGTTDEIGEVVIDIRFMVADIDDGGREPGERREERPLDFAGRPCRHRIAGFEQVAVQKNNVGCLVSRDAHFYGC
ncbi:hypothetical protein D3C87_1410260 [compost metagenome]